MYHMYLYYTIFGYTVLKKKSFETIFRSDRPGINVISKFVAMLWSIIFTILTNKSAKSQNVQ
jgi:hypothetical protein